MKRVGVFLIVVALIAGTVGCNGESCTLAISSTEGGSVTTPGEGIFTYDEGTVVTLVAEAEEGCFFVNWTCNVSTITDINADSTNITMNGDYIVMANFRRIPLVQHNLATTSTEGGSVTSPGEGMFTYSEGAVVNLVATPYAGYRFANWTGNTSTIANVNAISTSITMNDDYLITANFVVVYNLTVSSTTGGSVTVPGEGVFTYDEGTVVNLIVEAEEGYRFIKWTGDVASIADTHAASTNIIVNDNYAITADFGKCPMVSAGERHTVGQKCNGTVVAVGWNELGQCNVNEWTDIVQVAAGLRHTVGLRASGTVIATGDNNWGQCDVTYWTDIVQISAGDYHTVGLRTDGTVVAVGYDGHGECSVSGWTDVIQVSAGGYHTMGLRLNHTVLATGDNGAGQCNVGDWTDITQVDGGAYFTMGLKSNGTVVHVGDNTYGQCNVDEWTGIIQVSAGGFHTVAVKTNGTVVAVGDNGNGQCNVGGWTDITQVDASDSSAGFTLGLKADGTEVAVGSNFYGQCNVGGWDLN